MTGQQRVSRPIIRPRTKSGEKDALPRWANDRVGCQGRDISCTYLARLSICDACITVSTRGFFNFSRFFFLFFFFWVVILMQSDKEEESLIGSMTIGLYWLEQVWTKGIFLLIV